MEEELATNLMDKMDAYFDAMKNPHNPLHYDEAKIESHRELMRYYFARG